MSKQADKGGWSGRPLVVGETWAEFDGLPIELKRLFWFAPYNYAATGALAAVRRRGGLAATLLAGVESIERDVARETKRLYGEAQIGWVA